MWTLYCCVRQLFIKQMFDLLWIYRSCSLGYTVTDDSGLPSFHSLSLISGRVEHQSGSERHLPVKVQSTASYRASSMVLHTHKHTRSVTKHLPVELSTAECATANPDSIPVLIRSIFSKRNTIVKTSKYLDSGCE